MKEVVERACAVEVAKARRRESVLLLDRGNGSARQALRVLRLALTPKPSNALSRMLSRVFKRPALAAAARARGA